MKKIIMGIIAASILVSCVEDEIIIEKKHEKTKIEKPLFKNGQELKRELDTIRATPQTGPIKDLDPGGSLDPGEVGPIVTTPPK